MTEREMLEFAAKAAGIVAAWHCPPEEVDEQADYLARTEGMWLKGERTPDNSTYWNPLADDGDSRRLEVKTGVRNGRGFDNAWCALYAVGKLPADPYVATRLAVLYAAAWIGKAMP